MSADREGWPALRPTDMGVNGDAHDTAARIEDVERQARALRRLLRAFRSTSSYGLVLVMIVVTYVLATSLSGRWAVTILLFAQIATVWQALRVSLARRGFRRVATGLFVLSTIAAVANLFAAKSSGLVTAAFTAAALLYVVAPFSIVRHIGYRRTVDQETMLGALAAYLLIGMAFAFVYRLLGAAQASPFFGAGGDGTLSQDLFFSFITLTTTGYGNLVPAANPGQSLAVLEALTGQLFLVTAVAKVVSAWRPRGWRDPEPGSERKPARPP
jgi:Ion channel